MIWKQRRMFFFARPEDDNEDEIRKSGTCHYSAVSTLCLSSLYTRLGFVLCPWPQAATLSRVISVDLEPRTRPHYYYLLPLMRRPGVVATTICHKSGTDVLFPKKDGTIYGNITHSSLFCNRTYSALVELVGNSTRLPIGTKGGQANPCLTVQHNVLLITFPYVSCKDKVGESSYISLWWPVSIVWLNIRLEGCWGRNWWAGGQEEVQREDLWV